MKIVLTVPDVDPAQAGELMDKINEAMFCEFEWKPGEEYEVGVVE